MCYYRCMCVYIYIYIYSLISDGVCVLRWRLDNTDIVIGNDDGYSLMGGNLVISAPDKSKHAGNYSCLASNEFGTLVSQKASVQFGCESLL